MAQRNGARRWRRGGICNDDVSERGISNACTARVPLWLQSPVLFSRMYKRGGTWSKAREMEIPYRKSKKELINQEGSRLEKYLMVLEML